MNIFHICYRISLKPQGGSLVSSIDSTIKLVVSNAYWTTVSVMMLGSRVCVYCFLPSLFCTVLNKFRIVKTQIYLRTHRCKIYKSLFTSVFQ